MLTGLLSILLGVWIIRRVFRSKNTALDVTANYYQKQLQDRDNAIKVLETKLKEKNHNRDLNASILQDAINRENRAKGALAAVLLKFSATPEQIEHVLREVDGSEGLIDGD